MPPSTKPTVPINAATTPSTSAAGASPVSQTPSQKVHRNTPPPLARTGVPPALDRPKLGFTASTGWRFAFRFVRWTTYACTLITLILLFRTKRPPVIETSPQAAARVEQKLDQVDRAVANGQPATLHLDQTELNSYLASHLDIASNVAASQNAGGSAAGVGNAGSGLGRGATGTSDASGALADLQAPQGSPSEQIEQARSAVKDVKVELVGDHVRAYVIFDFHGKDMSLVLEGKLGSQDGYLQFEPVSGQIGSLPIPQSTLETAVRKMMESPENREKLRLPADMSGLKIENGEVVTTYKQAP